MLVLTRGQVILFGAEEIQRGECSETTRSFVA
jgi:hypothetical protein